jgi:alcohol dehydrogenase
VWTFNNPVSIRFGAASLDGIGDLIGGRAYGLVTYGEPAFAAIADRVGRLAGAPSVTVDTVVPNPHFDALSEACALYGQAPTPPGVIVAVGGGSVIDTAKVLAAANGDFARVRHFLETRQGAEALGTVPVIAVPTTAGTGSEVTNFATVWDLTASKKYSLLQPEGYPEHALVDPELTVGMPRSLTISTALDALSHAIEGIWNVNANPFSATIAVRAAREILAVLPVLVGDPGNLDLRTRMAEAALFAGLAFSNTKSALAHSLSYPITLRHGVPHGIACSFSLPMILRSVIGRDRECDARLQGIFGPDLDAGADRLADFLTGLGVSVEPADYGIGEAEFEALIDDAFVGERGSNFIGERDWLAVAAGAT